MQSSIKNFTVEKKCVKALKVIGLERNSITNGYDSFGQAQKPLEELSPGSQNPENSLPPKPQATPSPSLEKDYRLSQHARNNLNPDMLRAPSVKQTKSPTPSSEVTQEMKGQIKENMSFMKDLLELHKCIKGPLKKQVLMLRDYKDEHYHKMLVGFKVESFGETPSSAIKIETPEGQYLTITLDIKEIASNPDLIKDVWRYLKASHGDQRSFAFDFQITDPVEKTVTFYASCK